MTTSEHTNCAKDIHERETLPAIPAAKKAKNEQRCSTERKANAT
jgi:hypothetical protein